MPGECDQVIERERVKGNLRGSIPSPFLSIYHMVVVITVIELIRIPSRRWLDLMCGARLWISIDTAEWQRRRYSHVEPFKFPDFFSRVSSWISISDCGGRAVNVWRSHKIFNSHRTANAVLDLHLYVGRCRLPSRRPSWQRWWWCSWPIPCTHNR